VAPDVDQLTPSPPVETARTVPPLRAQEDEVMVRMYGQGLGDCFLLAFPRRATGGAGAGRPVHVLIDCGVLSGTPGSPQRMKQIVQDIRRTTRDTSLKRAADGEERGHIDLLVVTHEHWDHLSGFIYKEAREEWKNIQVDTVWTGWTAKHEANGLGEVLQKIKDMQQHALTAIEHQVQRFGVSERLQTALGLTLFLADKTEAPDRSLASGLNFVTQDLGKRSCVYCEPGEVRPVPGTDSVAYILGPPRNWNRLSRMNPSAETPETYENPFALRINLADEDDQPEHEQVRALRRILDEPSVFNAFIASLENRPVADEDETSTSDGSEPLPDIYYRSFPFDRSFRIPLAIAESRAANARSSYPALDSYFDSVNQWRRIDDDWLLAADTFALAADNFVNNTSLVLAFEMPPSRGSDKRNVLLFVADAQVGNWLSWDEIPEWTLCEDAKPAQGGSKPDIDDLLRRTVFYKVGHHGSHNATLKTRGVERMTGEGPLTAFVPVSPAVAQTVGWTEMPLKAILDALAKRTGGRVVLPGDVWPPAKDEAERQAARDRIGVEVSEQMLPEKRGGEDDRKIEDPVPLWVQIAVRN
jgi:hypothetical protein